jgi:hypothetical protein
MHKGLSGSEFCLAVGGVYYNVRCDEINKKCRAKIVRATGYQDDVAMRQ